jgi:hypothetical protein
MKITSFRNALLALAAILAFFMGTGSAPAQINIHIGGGPPPPPPPVVVEQPWAPPYQGAVWIRGHHEWRGGAWVWVGGYYAYPPHPGAVWIEGHVGHDGNWHPGHWGH